MEQEKTILCKITQIQKDGVSCSFHLWIFLIYVQSLPCIESLLLTETVTENHN